MFLFVFTGVGGVLRFPWHLVRGMDRVGVENRRASFVVVWFCSLCCRSKRWSFKRNSACILHIMRGEMSSIKDKGVIVVKIAKVVTLAM